MVAMAIQGVFATKPQPSSDVTFVITTQRDLGGQPLRHASTVYTHVAKHGHTKRRKRLFQVPDSPLRTTTGILTKSHTAGEHPDHHRNEEMLVQDRPRRERESPYAKQHLVYVFSDNTLTYNDLLQSVLDPFLHLPIETSTRERTNFAYYLTEWRKLIPGTSTNAANCVAIRVTQDWLQYSPLHTLQILMHSEFMLSKMTGKSLPPTFYKRRMQAFAMVRQILDSQDATFSYKLFAIMTVLWMAYTMELSDLQTHLNAINVLLESADKGQKFKTRELEGPTLRPQWLVGMFLVNEFRISDHEHLCTAKMQFFSSLKHIEAWRKENMLSLSLGSSSTARADQGELLQDFDLFLSEPLKAKRLSTNLPFAVAAAPFFCSFSICATMAARKMKYTDVRDFLLCIQRKLVRIDNGCSNGGTALSHILGDARLETSTVDKQQELAFEVSISQSVINALKLYSLLSTNTRIELTTLLYEVAMLTTHPTELSSTAMVSVGMACAQDIENNWSGKRP